MPCSSPSSGSFLGASSSAAWLTSGATSASVASRLYPEAGAAKALAWALQRCACQLASSAACRVMCGRVVSLGYRGIAARRLQYPAYLHAPVLCLKELQLSLAPRQQCVQLRVAEVAGCGGGAALRLRVACSRAARVSI